VLSGRGSNGAGGDAGEASTIGAGRTTNGSKEAPVLITEHYTGMAQFVLIRVAYIISYMIYCTPMSSEERRRIRTGHLPVAHNLELFALAEGYVYYMGGQIILYIYIKIYVHIYIYIYMSIDVTLAEHVK